MAHFAQLDENNVVTNVVVVGNSDVLDQNGNESEAVGVAFLKNLFGQDTRWVQTSYNNNIRRKYACIGDTYDGDLNIFKQPQPFPSWTYKLTETENTWVAPFPHPNDASILKRYSWNEANVSWDFTILDESGNVISRGSV